MGLLFEEAANWIVATSTSIHFYCRLQILNFRAKNIIAFNFCGWSQPQKLNNYVSYFVCNTSNMGMNMHRTLEKKRNLTQNGPTKAFPESALNVDQTLESDRD